MKSVVITGSTRGIGYGLAAAFLDLGCVVTISGRSEASVSAAIAPLTARYGAAHLFGQPCDVGRFPQVQALWDAAATRWGHVDIWINNAGAGNRMMDFWRLPPDEVRQVVETNLLGIMYGSTVALRGMMAQRFGALYNMEGMGSDGQIMPGLALYGTTKRGVRYFSAALAKEVEGTPLLVGTLSPGMVLTDLLLNDREMLDEKAWARRRRIFNILADEVETVTPWLARRVLNNRRNKVRIQWLTRQKAMLRFLLAPFRRRDLFTERPS